MAKPNKVRYEPVTAEEAADLIGEGVHVGLRKGSEAPSSAALWRAISESGDTAWSDAVKYCVWGLDMMGFAVCKKVS
jgi:adenine deaminase